MWIAHFATLTLLATGCGGGASSSPSAQAVSKGGDAIGAQVEAYGVVTGVTSVHLARTAAENRGISALAPMLTVGGLSFTARVAHGYSTLQVTGGGKAKYLNSSFIPITDGWMARVVGRRSPEVATQMRQLESHVGEATVSQADLGQAFNAAKSRAFRKVIKEEAEVKCQSPCELSGKLTLIAMHVEPTDSGVKVSLRAHVDVTSNSELDNTSIYDVQNRALAEHERLGELEKAQDVLSKSLEMFPDDPALYAARGRIAMQGSDFGTASESFDKALTLAPETVTYALSLADAYEKAGEKRKTADTLRKAIALDPSNASLASRYNAVREELQAEGEAIPALGEEEKPAPPPASPKPVEDAPSNEEPPPDVDQPADTKAKAKSKGKRRKGKRKKRKPR